MLVDTSGILLPKAEPRKEYGVAKWYQCEGRRNPNWLFHGMPNFAIMKLTH
jgi:hypothetical protein